jgi:hypothetical protein
VPTIIPGPAVRAVNVEPRAATTIDPTWQSLVNRLLAASPEFARLWKSHEVSEAVPEWKQIRNPEVGVMRFDLSTGRARGDIHCFCDERH